MMKWILAPAFFTLGIIGCSTTPEIVIEEVEVTREVEVEVTRIVEVVPTEKGGYVTRTPDCCPCNPTKTTDPNVTPSPTVTHEPTRTKVPTVDPLKQRKSNGFYLINVDIAPGMWRSSPGRDDCYWARTDENGNILSNHFGDSGGAVRLHPADFQVEFNDCGSWEWIGE